MVLTFSAFRYLYLPRNPKDSLSYFLKVFKVLFSSLLKFLIHPETLLLYGVRYGSSFCLDNQLSQYHLSNGPGLPHLIPFSKIKCLYRHESASSFSVLFHWPICLALHKHYRVFNSYSFRISIFLDLGKPFKGSRLEPERWAGPTIHWKTEAQRGKTSFPVSHSI